MTPSQWERAKDIFEASLEVSEASRAAYLLRVCAGDEEVRREVEELLEADRETDSFLDPKWIPSMLAAVVEFQLEPGDVVSGRFHIVRAVGSGGMGRVYEARDAELGSEVALKTLRPEVANNVEVLQRFRQEVKIAHRITHPNVCRTHHLDREVRQAGSETIELTFLTMEFLSGETMQQALKTGGRFAVGRALEIARQMASGIAAAHAIGAIHRDIKPGNVMLCPAGDGERVVITDFGLAKFDASGVEADVTSISRAGQAMGTLSYMAPEQLEGGETTPATDIYAFGLVLFEMVTGRKAFPDSGTLMQAIRSREETMPSPKALVPELPEAWQRAIQGCLEPMPSRRLASAADVIAVLEGGKVAPRMGVARRASWFSQRRMARAAIVVVCLSLLGVGLRLWLVRADSKVAAGALVYLAPVENRTGDRTMDNVTELISAGLAQSVQVNLLDRGRVGDLLGQMNKKPDAAIDQATGREIAMRGGADRVIFASVSGGNGKYQLDIDLQKPDSKTTRFRNHWEAHFPWTGSVSGAGTMPAEMLQATRNASDWVRHEVGESANDIARLDVPPEDVTSANWQALADYSGAAKRIAVDDKESGIELLKEAVKIDPNFAQAYAVMGDILVSTGRRREGYKAYMSALSEGAGERLSRRERDFIKGTFAADTRDFNTALSAFRDYSAFYENDFTGWFYQAEPLEFLDRPQDAIAVLMRADGLTKDRHAAAGELVYNYLMVGDHASARKWIETTRTTGRPDFATYLTGIDQFLEEKYPEAEATYAGLKDVRSDHYRQVGYAMRARVQAEEGRYADALSTLAEADVKLLGNKDERGLRKLDFAYLQCRMGSFALCLEDLRDGIAGNPAPNSILWASTIVGQAMPSLKGGDRKRALDALTEMQRLLAEDGDSGVVFEVASERVRGEMLLAQGDAKGALECFERADKMDAPLTPREYLARGLEAAANAAPEQALELRERALDAYGRAALRPEALWQNPWDYPPGFFADQMTNYLKLAARLGRDDAQTKRAAAMLAQLRKSPERSVQHPPSA